MAAIIKLDWSRLLGFDQAPRSGETDTPRADAGGPMPLGAKVGGKFGTKHGVKLDLRGAF
jgi:hypothetical protein